MKITAVTARAESRLRATPIRDALQTLDTQGSCQITIATDAGINGQGTITFGRLDRAPAVLAALVEEIFAPALVGADATLIRGIRDQLWRLTDYHGSTGLSLLGVAGVDIALWDIMGKAANQPVWKLLGAQRDRVPSYAMVGWSNYDVPELQRVCERAIALGFGGVKMKVGAPTLAEDVRRIEAVRAAVGPDAPIMVDANQVFSRHEALRRGRVYEELGCFWFEEPLRADDTDGLAELAHALTIPIASGENNFGKRQFLPLFERRAVDIVQPDLRRAGGVTECLEIGLLADTFGVPYASHGGGVHLHILAALPNALYLESGTTADGTAPGLIDGHYLLPQEPGFGGRS